MSSTSFGDVTYSQPEETSTTAPAGPNGQAQEVVIDPNDPLLTSEPLEMNLDANAYDVPPPAPDGFWRARLKQVDINDKAGKPQKHITGAFQNPYRPFFCVNIETHLIDQTGKNDDVTITDYWVKTTVDKRQKISQLASIGVAIGLRDQLATANSQKDVLDIVERGLAGEPNCVVQTQWQWACRGCDDRAGKQGKSKPGVFLREQLSAPADGKGGKNPTVRCGTCGAQCRAQARVVNYLPATAKVTQGVGK